MLHALLHIPLPKELITMAISAIPGFGLSVALPVSIHLFNFSWFYAFFLSVVGNMLPIPFLLILWEDIEKLLEKNSLFRRWITLLHTRTLENKPSVEKYGILGLVIFVAVPAPMTGAATASLIAVILGMNFWHSFLAILWGVLLSAIVITTLCLLGWTGAIIAGVSLVGLTALSLFRKKSRKDNAQT